MQREKEMGMPNYLTTCNAKRSSQIYDVISCKQLADNKFPVLERTVNKYVVRKHYLRLQDDIKSYFFFLRFEIQSLTGIFRNAFGTIF